MAFVGAIALGLFIGSYAITRSTSNGKVVPPSDGPPPATAAVPGPDVDAGGGAGAVGAVVSPSGTGWAPVPPDPASKPVAGNGGSHHSTHPPKQPVVVPGPAPTPSPPVVHREKDKDCDPPYTLEPDGTRKYKMSCIEEK
jgi:hypothetical protein